VSLERRLQKLEGKTRKSGFTLVDGSRYTYDADNLWKQTFVHACECLHADGDLRERPPAPPVVRALCRAKDRHAAVTQIYPAWEARPAMCGYDLHHLVEYGELKHQRFAPGYEPVQDFEEGEL
jgi:hypothetical protein